MPYYLMTCECGETLKVEQWQAGISITCECGLEVQVPTLVQLRRMPLENSHPNQPIAPIWTPQQGFLYAAGIIIVVISAVAIVSLLVLLSRESTARPTYSFQRSVDSLTPTDAWTAWQDLSMEQLGPRRTPAHIASRQYCRYLYICLAVSVILALIGATLSVLSLRIRRQSS